MRPSKRTAYAHGAFWGGPKEEIFTMCEVLAKLTDQDLMGNYIPTWHDESYLNFYNCKNKLSFIGPKDFSGSSLIKSSLIVNSTIISIPK